MKKFILLLLCLSCCALTACTLFDKEAPTYTKLQSEKITLEVNSELHLDDYFMFSDNQTDSDNIILEYSYDSSKIGIQEIEIFATDEAKNTNHFKVNVEFLDNTSPTITLIGDEQVHVGLNENYEEEGVYVKDNFDEDCTLTIYGEVNTSALGRYVKTYIATDTSGNAAQIKRTVDVVDITPPTFDISELQTNLTLGEIIPELYAIDDIDGEIPIRIEGELNYCSAGEYTVNFIAEDSYNNITSVQKVITIAPITIPCSNGLNVELTEFTKDFENLNPPEGSILRIYIDVVNTLDKDVDLTPHFWWINDEFGNNGLYNANISTAYATSDSFIRPNWHKVISYDFLFDREPELFYNCDEIRFDYKKEPIGSANKNKYKICLQELFDASITVLDTAE